MHKNEKYSEIYLFPDNNTPFTSLESYDWVDKGKLIWSIRNTNIGYGNEEIVEGPFELVTPWCSSLLGVRNQGLGDEGVKYVNLSNGEINFITLNSLLFTTYYVVKGDIENV